MKIINRYLLSTITAIIVLACDSSSDVARCQTGNCNNYQTQEQAQAAFDADKTCLKNLDADGDGTACEELINGGGTNCPTTSNCGCSNKKKDQCASSCCKWVTGTGCVCK